MKLKPRSARAGIGQPIHAQPRAELGPLALGETIDQIAVADLKLIAVAAGKNFLEVLERGGQPESRRRVDQQVAADHVVELIERLDVLGIEPNGPRLGPRRRVAPLNIARQVVVGKAGKTTTEGKTVVTR